MQIPEEAIVYRPWPTKTIHDAISQFNDIMHDGAGIEELSAGLHGLDFLCRRSALDDVLQSRLDGCTVEAHWRIELLQQQEAEQRTHEENIQRAYTAIRSLKLQSAQLLSRMRHYGEDAMRIKYPDLFTDDEDEDD